MTTILITLIVSGIFLFIADWVSDKSMNIVGNTISDYANGKYGYLTTAGFIIYGLSVAVSSFYILVEHGVLYSVFRWTIFGYGIGVAMLALFKCDKSGESTLHGKLHNVFANISMIGISLNILYFFILNIVGGEFVLPTLILGVVNLVSAILFAFSFKYVGSPGIWERICMFSQFAWVLTILYSYSIGC